MDKNKSNIVRRPFDPNSPPTLTAEQRAELEALAAMPDEEIDYSDAPHQPAAVWMHAGLPVFMPKKQVTLRIDADVLDFFKNTGKRYQSRINSVLRAYVAAHMS
jgi:uncharacterized protein (DUF4415 family)